MLFCRGGDDQLVRHFELTAVCPSDRQEICGKTKRFILRSTNETKIELTPFRTLYQADLVLSVGISFF